MPYIKTTPFVILLTKALVHAHVCCMCVCVYMNPEYINMKYMNYFHLLLEKLGYAKNWDKFNQKMS